MTNKLYVGNLATDATETQLRELFSQAGDIGELTLLTDVSTGQGRGFGFVEMTTEEGAQEAIKRFNGYTFGSRDLIVNVARPRRDRAGGATTL